MNQNKTKKKRICTLQRVWWSEGLCPRQNPSWGNSRNQIRKKFRGHKTWRSAEKIDWRDHSKIRKKRLQVGWCQTCFSFTRLCKAALCRPLQQAFLWRFSKFYPFLFFLIPKTCFLHKGLVVYFSSGPVLCLAFEGDNVISETRKMLGATNPKDSLPGSIRGDYSINVGRNIIHASDSPASAAHELKLWFKEGELLNWSQSDSTWVYEKWFPCFRKTSFLQSTLPSNSPLKKQTRQSNPFFLWLTFFLRFLFQLLFERRNWKMLSTWRTFSECISK